MSSRRETINAILDAHRVQDIDKIISYHNESCTWEVRPSKSPDFSVPLFRRDGRQGGKLTPVESLGQSPLDNTAYKAMFQATAPAFRNYQVTVTDIFEDEKDNKAIVWIDAAAETDAGPYTNEKMMVFYFDGEGKMSRMVEFVDSAVSIAFYAKLQDVVAKGKE
jgi:ketosteroid isomerase-like protein